MISDLQRAFLDFRQDLDPEFRRKMAKLRELTERLDKGRTRERRELDRYMVMRGYAEGL